MFRTKRLLIAFTKFHEQSCALVSSSVCVVRRSLCSSSGRLSLDDKMSGKSLPKWIKPEGDGELKLYNSLTREKVNKLSFSTCWLFSFSGCKHLSDATWLFLLKPANQINIRLILPASLVIIQSESLFFHINLFRENHGGCLFPSWSLVGIIFFFVISL